MDNITYEDFKKLDMRVGKIVHVEPVEGTDKLLKCLIDFGPELATTDFTTEDGTVLKLRQIVSGIKEYFSDYKKLEGKFALYCINLEPREIKGVTSYGMLMAVDGLSVSDITPPVFLVPETEVVVGTKVR